MRRTTKQAQKRKKKPTRPHLTFLSTLYLHGVVYIVCLCIILVTGGIVAYTVSNTLPHPLLEIPKNEMKKLPPDVKKQLRTHPINLSATIRVPILMYHYVEYIQDKGDKIRQLLNTTPDVFEQQVQTMQNAGYTFMSAKDLGNVLDGLEPLPPKPVLLTFDDGHWDFATVVLPILEKYHVKATAYIITGFLGGSDFMTQQQVQAVVASGLVDVGAHTVHHVAMKSISLQQATEEVVESKRFLENTYHIHVVSFAYPYGSFDTQAMEVVKNAGFTTAVSTLPGVIQSQENRYFLYRIRPGYRTGQDLLSYLEQQTYSAY